MTKLLFILLAILRVALVGDPQVDDEKELEFAKRTIYSELSQRNDLDLIIVLGDLVNENEALVAPSEELLDATGHPWVRVHGNHDGPLPESDTSFTVGGIRFLLLNHYGLRENRRDIPDSVSLKMLESIEPGQKTVVCTHIPIDDRLISGYGPDVLFACAHMHIVMRYLLEGGAGKIVAGASCGSWWRGVRGPDGIPHALMNCGAPRGYFIADFDPDKEQWYSLRYKCVGRPESDRASAFLRDGRLVVNVFGGSRGGRLEMRKGLRWVEIPRKPVISPDVQDVIDFNREVMTREYRREHPEEFLPMLRYESPHTWCIEGLSRLRKGKRIRIRYADEATEFKGYVTIR